MPPSPTRQRFRVDERRRLSKREWRRRRWRRFEFAARHRSSIASGGSGGGGGGGGGGSGGGGGGGSGDNVEWLRALIIRLLVCMRAAA